MVSGLLRRAAAIICLSFAALAWAAEAPLQIAPIPFTERVLANGLQVIAVPSSASPTVSVQVWYHVGSKDDPAGRSGFAHLFEHPAAALDLDRGTRCARAEQIRRQWAG